MKITSDNKEIPSRIWYYLLDWNENDKWNTIQLLYNKNKLKDLTKSQILNLLYVAAKIDIKDNK